MKKGKVAAQFLSEAFVITLAAVIIGAGIGAATSVPVTNVLLKNKVEEAQRSSDSSPRSSRPNGGFAKSTGGMSMKEMSFPNMGFGQSFSGVNRQSTKTDYVSSVSSATNITVVLQMLGIAVILKLVSGAASMLFVMRYDPLKILANRD